MFVWGALFVNGLLVLLLLRGLSVAMHCETLVYAHNSLEPKPFPAPILEVRPLQMVAFGLVLCFLVLLPTLHDDTSIQGSGEVAKLPWHDWA